MYPPQTSLRDNSLIIKAVTITGAEVIIDTEAGVTNIVDAVRDVVTTVTINKIRIINTTKTHTHRILLNSTLPQVKVILITKGIIITTIMVIKTIIRQMVQIATIADGDITIIEVEVVAVVSQIGQATQVTL